MKIEAGKRYRTRDGRVVKVLVMGPDGDWWGHYAGCAHPQRWYADGRFFYQKGGHEQDMIAPYWTAGEVVLRALPASAMFVPREEVAERISAALREAGLLKEE